MMKALKRIAAMLLCLVLINQLFDPRKCPAQLILLRSANDLYTLGCQSQRVADCDAHCFRAVIETYASSDVL